MEQVKLALGVAKGMDYLAEVGYVHRVSWKAAVIAHVLINYMHT